MRSFLPADIYNCFNAAGNLVHPRIFTTLRRFVADVVRTGEHDDDLRIDIIQLSLVETPENVLRGVATPAEVGSVPAKEILPPVHQKLAVLFVAGSPTPRDRVAFEIDVYASTPGFL